MKRGSVLSTLVLLMTLLLIAGCGGGTSSQPPVDGSPAAQEPATSKEIVVAVGVDATSMDPAMSTNITDKHVATAIFDTLLIRDNDMTVQPNVAVRWEAVDPLTWEFELRPGITFTNGEPLNAEAVKFTIDRILDPDFNAPSFAQFTAIERVDVIDELTVHIVTSEPYPVLPAVMAELWIVPPGYVQEVGKEAFGQQPIGSGPFKLVDWVRDEHIILEANPDYWNGAPNLSRVTFKPVPEQGARITMLQAGDAHIVAGIPPYMVAQLESHPDIRIATAPGARSYFVGINTLADSPLKDPKVRQALNYAVDVETIIDTTLEGYGQRLASLLTPRQVGFDPDLEAYPYDPDRARQLLAEAGYPDGFTVRFEAPNGRYPMDREVAQTIAGQLEQIGLDVDLQVMEWGTYVNQFREKPEEEMAPLYFLGWSIPTFDADAILFALARPGQTYSRYHNPEVADLLLEARYEIDAERRVQLYHEALAIMREDAPFIWLYQMDDIYGIRADVDWEPRSDERIYLDKADIR